MAQLLLYVICSPRSLAASASKRSGTDTTSLWPEQPKGGCTTDSAYNILTPIKSRDRGTTKYSSSLQDNGSF
ncbi:hypothetical protein EDB83DRAFT_1944910 [Lactarius deliciosus]|nr:hypothetical protein EDB83DRAFT_1944910 [Lactarius deliciosus]